MPEISWGRADLHMHTQASDGLLPVQDLLKYIQKLGTLDVIAITDHDTLDASLWAYEHRKHYTFDIVPGVEISSNDGHVLGWWVTKPIPAGLSLIETVTAIHEQGGIAILAHPFHIQMPNIAKRAWHYWRKPELLLEAGLDGLEIYNAGRVIPFTNAMAAYYAQRHNFAVSGSSDAHTAGAVGRGYTLFPGKTAHDLRQAIETHQTIAKGRPWPLIDYWKFSLSLMRPLSRRRLAASLNSSQSNITPHSPQ
ncbi:MAG: PHP domain-containing protein [Chloroflexi bacterium]|nr:MAG: PHP domain-containing protein [Chloroflexota bacterium]